MYQLHMSLICVDHALSVELVLFESFLQLFDTFVKICLAIVNIIISNYITSHSVHLKL